MHRYLFIQIVEALGDHSKCCRLRYDAIGRQGSSPLTKCAVALRILAYGTSSDILDDYLQIGESTTYECFKKICQGIIEAFGEEYLRRPNEVDIARLLAIRDDYGFPKTLQSLD